MFYVYMIMNLINWKIYIGQTTNLTVRWRDHLKSASKPKSKKHQLLHKALAKYGVSNFIFTTIQSSNDYAEALELEKYWIEFYQSNTKKYGSSAGYNQTAGGEGWLGNHHTKETKLKISIKNSGKIRSESFKKERSKWYSGEGNPMYGKNHTKKTRKKIGETRKEKLLASGENNPKAKLTEEMVKNIKLLLRDDNLSQKEIANLYNVWPSAIQKIASGLNWKNVIV